MHEKRYPGDRLYRFVWKRNISPPAEGYGRDVADAFSRLGYGGGAIHALESWKQIKAPRKKKADAS